MLFLPASGGLPDGREPSPYDRRNGDVTIWRGQHYLFVDRDGATPVPARCCKCHSVMRAPPCACRDGLGVPEGAFVRPSSAPPLRPGVGRGCLLLGAAWWARRQMFN